MRKPCKEIHLQSYDELFGLEPEVDRIIMVPLKDLHEFRNHPFRVKDDEKMKETVESIRQYGVLVPGIVRPRTEGGYELISGHRRKRGSELAGKTEMPVIVRNYTNDEATIIMVDSNIQREELLVSEKAKAYRMKYEAMKHQGVYSGRSTLEEVGAAAGDNAKKVQRYIWLSRLSDELLDLVDKKKLGFSQGIDLSSLSKVEQFWVYEAILDYDENLSILKSSMLKEYSKQGLLNKEHANGIVRASKGCKRKIVLHDDNISKFFDARYSDDEIETIILELLQEWRNRNQR